MSRLTSCNEIVTKIRNRNNKNILKELRKIFIPQSSIFSIDLLKVLVAPRMQYTDEWWSFPLETSFSFIIKILVYTLEFSTTQVFIPSTASFLLMVVLDVGVLFSLGTHVVNAFLYFIFVSTIVLRIFYAPLSVYLSDLDIQYMREFVYI